MLHLSLPIVLALSLFAPSVSSQANNAETATRAEIRFDRDVRPILSDRCFRCHGPDAASRKAKLRLDTREGAFAPRKDGRVLVPGDPAASLLVQRIRHADAGERMPPADSGKTLSPDEIALLARWIQEGAQWERHWSYEPVVRPAVPEVDSSNNPIDRFLAARWKRLGIAPTPAADARTLVRRLYLDVLGIPPEPEVVGQFVEDPSESAWRALVDRLLESPHHAERLTMYWLDLVRYGDSCGIHGDQDISMSPYRDWVIQAFRENKRFDVFTREQLAGDLLPNATLQQRVASGYNRLNPKTAEGGAQDKEYLAKYAADRVRTTATTWLGSTVGCAECHDHKFDPFSTRDFYRFAAYFADLDHKGYYGGANRSGDWGPKVAVPTREQSRQLTQLSAEVARLQTEYEATSPEFEAAQLQWEDTMRASLAKSRPPQLGAWRSVGPFRAADLRRAHDKVFGPENDARPGRRYGELAWRERPHWRDGRVQVLRGANSATYLARTIVSLDAMQLQLSLGSDDSIKLWVNGELVLDRFVMRGAAAGQEKPVISLRKGDNELLMKICNGGGNYGFYFATSRSGPPTAIAKVLQTERQERTAGESRKLASHYRKVAPMLAAVRTKITTARTQLARVQKSMTTSLVSKVRTEPRVTRVLARGNWQDVTGEVVEPGVPTFLGNAPRNDGRQSRLDLARWLTSRENPLTARVFVNRLWKLYFGRGLSRVLDDLGSQGHRPEHRELLDWLAAEFMESGWDVRATIRLLLTSSVYRRSSIATPALASRDPDNREFARQRRFRHDAEVVRDNALAISGLLERRIGGASVKPYQPVGYWSQLNFPKRRYVHDTGSEQYRRGLYTHWQRTFLHPSLVAFDAPPREECTAERSRSSTPLQALVLLNDPTFVEAARVLAARVLRDAPANAAARITWLYRRALARAPSAEEMATLESFLGERVAHYRKSRDAAVALTKVGLATADAGLEPVEHAAWIALARAVLNLHETNTRY